MPYLYVIRMENSSYRKIGYTDGELQKRVAALQTGCPIALVLEHAVETPLCREVERLLHGVFAERHVRGEWFDVDIESILEKLAILEEFIAGVDEQKLLEITDSLLPATNTLTATDAIAPNERVCPYCRFTFSSNNIRRHMRFCQELSQVNNEG